MSSNRERADRVTRALHAIAGGEPVELGEVLTDDVRIWTPEVSVSGLPELLAVVDRRDDAFTDVRLDVVPLDVGDDYACAEWTVEMVHSGRIEFADGTAAEPTSRVLVLHGATVAEFIGDKICSLRQYWDRLELLEQLDPPAG